MSRNIEIKAKILDFQTFLDKANCISDKPVIVMHQVDTYFKIPSGRLKLRQIENQRTELIYYDRPDTEGPKLSKYSKQEFQNFEEAEGLKKVLESSLGLVGMVDKQRYLYMHGQTRIHVDDVKNLGHFMELEVVLKEGETIEYGEKIAHDLMLKLGIQKEDLLSGSYINLLENKNL
ncbi:CYTH domain-containing protein [Nephila pilipes]|uniref:CYTH domain-containing protein n=1 Tax=Nephila pilipes TaxID=299642 RepID=A0A8X6JH75_NEPPI|nr:CYTH domain-containing protein [Nephila pilipes]